MGAPRTSHLAHLAPRTSHLTPRTSHFAPRTSHTSHLAPRTSHLAHLVRRPKRPKRPSLGVLSLHRALANYAYSAAGPALTTGSCN